MNHLDSSGAGLAGVAPSPEKVSGDGLVGQNLWSVCSPPGQLPNTKHRFVEVDVLCERDLQRKLGGNFERPS